MGLRWGAVLTCPFLHTHQTQANRACPDVINWSISANNTAQTYHYTQKAFSFFSSKQDSRFSSFGLKQSLPPLQWFKTAGDALSDISCLVMDSWTGEKKMIYCSTCRDSHYSQEVLWSHGSWESNLTICVEVQLISIAFRVQLQDICLFLTIRLCHEGKAWAYLKFCWKTMLTTDKSSNTRKHFGVKILFLLLSYCRKLPRLASANIFRLKYCQNHIYFFHVMSNMDNFSSTTLRRGLLPSVNSRDDINVQFKSEYGDY